ncbi:MAG: two-component sensor histidine kinase, partial [Actinobacteria bacterium]|nr:two-component sensor histidine kinase [Actinomycetota bacterium]
MTGYAPPAFSGRRKAMWQAANRVPLRIRLITAVLALVIIALAVISMVGLAEFRGYLQDRADA